MSITKKLVVTLEDDIATPSEKVFIYKGDIGVDIIIELENFNYKIDSLSKKNMINRIEAYFKTPQGIVKQYNDEVNVINGDRIKFSFNKKVIDDMQIIGQYELQFHLFDKENNRITIPSYYFYVKEPLHNTSEEQEGDESRVDYARVDYSKVKDDIVLFEVSENGYIKTNWQSGDLITSGKLNKIEAQLETNTNKINEIQPYDDTEINNSLNRLSENIKNLNIPTKTSELENDSDFTTNSYVNEMLGGKKLVYLTQTEYDNLTEEEKNNENIVYNITDSSKEYVTIDDLDSYATKTYVNTKIAEASLGGEVDLSNYATKTDLNSKVDKIEGKGLSTNDYTDEEKNKLNDIEEGANNYIHPTKHEASIIIEDNTHRFVTDEEKNEWNNKSEFNGSYNDLTNKPNIPTKTSELVNDSNYATKTDLNSKVDKIEGKVLSSNDYTNEEKNKLSNIEEGANNYIHPTKHEASIIIEDSEHRFVSDNEKSGWNNKSNFSGSYNDLTNKPKIPSLDGYATQTYVANAIAEAQLSGGDVDLSGYATKDDLHYHDNKEILDGITGAKVTSWDNKSDFSGNYNDLTNKPSIPTKTSELENDSDFATKTDLNSKVDKIEGKGLSTNDYTNEEKNKLSTIEENANNYTHPITHDATIITQDATHRFVTDTEKANWNNKSDFNGNYNDLIDKPIIPTVTNDLTDELKANYDIAYTHSQSAHAPSNAQKNSDITKSEIEAKLVGDIATHTHNQYLTEHQSLNGYAKITDLHSHSNKTILDSITSDKITNWDNKSDFSGSYNDLTDKPTIPSEYILPIANQTTLGGIKVGAGLSITSEGVLSANGGGTADSVDWENVVGRPTNLSQFTNDTGFITDIPSEYITETELEAKGYLTEHQDISGLATKSELNSKVDKVSGKGLSTNDLTNTLKSNYDTAYTHSQTPHITTDNVNTAVANYVDEHKAELKGDKGDTGASGKDGVTPTLSIGTVATGNAGSGASVTMGGTAPNYTLNFTIPRGDKGENGNDASVDYAIETLTTTSGNVTLSSNMYQKVTATGNLNITLPTVSSNTLLEIHLFYNASSSYTLTVDTSVEWQSTPTLEANITTEFIFTWNGSKWLAGAVAYNGQGASGGGSTSSNASTINGYSVWVGTQAQYNALSSKDSMTIYFVKEG